MAICAIIIAAWQSKEQIIPIFYTSNPFSLIASICIWISLHFLSPVSTKLLFGTIGQPIKYSDALHIHIKYLPAKYIPGGIWHSVARIIDYHKHKITRKNLATYLVLENISIAAISISLGGSIIYFISELTTLWYWITLLLLTICIPTLFAIPFIVKHRHLINNNQTYIRWYILYILSIIIYWVTAALSFILFLTSFPTLLVDMSHLEAGGIYVYSWGIGFITVFAPQGIGVSEFVSSHLISSDISISGLIVVLATFRFVVLIGDLSVWLLSLFANTQDIRK